MKRKMKPRSLAFGWTEAEAIRSWIDHHQVPQEIGTVIRIRSDHILVIIRCLQETEPSEAMNVIRDLALSGNEFDYMVSYKIPGCKKRIRGRGILQDIKVFHILSEVSHVRLFIKLTIKDPKKDLVL